MTLRIVSDGARTLVLDEQRRPIEGLEVLRVEIVRGVPHALLRADGISLDMVAERRGTLHAPSEWVGDRLRVARKARGLTLRVVAEQVGVSQATVSRWERGQLVPGYVHAVSLSKLFGDGSKGMAGRGAAVNGRLRSAAVDSAA